MGPIISMVMLRSMHCHEVTLGSVQLRCLAVERVHHFAHAGHGLQGNGVRLVTTPILKQDQHPLTLVKDTWNGMQT